MTFRCPNPACDAGVRLGECSCGKCGQSLGAVAVLRLLLRGWWERLKGLTHTRCPECREIIPLREPLCPRCGVPVTFSGAVASTTNSPRSAVKSVLRNLSPEAKAGIRWSYVIVSALLFWLLVLRVNKQWTDDWLGYAALDVVYLAFLYLLFLWVVPGDLRARVGRRLRITTKVGVIFNFFSLLLVLLQFIASYRGQAAKIALLFGITFAAFWIFTQWMRGIWMDLASDWSGAPPSFNHLGNQGRTAHRDNRR